MPQEQPITFNGCSEPPKQNALQRLLRRFYPYRKETPTELLRQRFVHGMVTETTYFLSFSDRLRILFGGNITVKVVSGTEHDAGESQAVASIQVLHPIADYSVRKPKKK